MAYNKDERGGWYCTNPKKHEESELHHAANEPHEHSAERNDRAPERQPDARLSRQGSSAKNGPLSDGKKKLMVKAIMIVLFWSVIIPLIFICIAAINSNDGSGDEDWEYEEYYEDEFDTTYVNPYSEGEEEILKNL